MTLNKMGSLDFLGIFCALGLRQFIRPVSVDSAKSSGWILPSQSYDAWVTVNIGGLDFAPLAIFLHQSEESWKFRLILIAPLFEQNHRHIIGSLFIRSSSLEDGQTEVFEQIIFKRLGATVFTDSHITNDEFSTKSLLKRVWSKVCPVLGDALTMLRWRVGGES